MASSESSSAVPSSKDSFRIEVASVAATVALSTASRSAVLGSFGDAAVGFGGGGARATGGGRDAFSEIGTVFCSVRSSSVRGLGASRVRRCLT